MTVAVIGADEESLHAIRQAKKQGFKVVAVDQNSQAPGLTDADVKLNIPISEENQVIEALKEQKVDLVLTAPIGRHLSTIGAVNDALGLPGISKKSAQMCSDKYAFHSRLRNVKLRGGHCYLVNSNQLFDPSQISYPAILKPRFGSHGRSVHLLENATSLLELEEEIWGDNEGNKTAQEQLNEFITEMGKDSDPTQFVAMLKKTLDEKRKVQNGEDDPNIDYILEEALPGVEYAVDGVVEGCNFELVLLRRKVITPPPARAAVAYVSVVPYEEHRLLSLVRDYMSKVCEAMNLKDCMIHADIMVLGSKCSAIEVSASPAGHHIYDEIIPMSTGVDICSQYLTYMRGEIHNFSPLNSKKMMMHYFNMENCFVHKIPSERRIKEILPEKVKLRKWVCNIILLDYMGSITDEDSLLRRGYYILEGPNDRVLMEAADLIMSEFELK